MHPSYMTPVIEAMVGGFMEARDRWAPVHSIRREFLDGLMSATVIDRGTEFFLVEMKLPQADRKAIKEVVTHLMKLLYDLESRRFEKGDHTDGVDVIDAVKNRYLSHYSSQAMKAAAVHAPSLSMWNHSEGREASRRLAIVMKESFGEQHGQGRGSRW